MEDISTIILVAAILCIFVSVKFIASLIKHFLAKRKYLGSAVGKVVDTEFNSQPSTIYRRRGRTYENPYESSISYKAVIEYEGHRATCPFSTKASIPEGIEVFVKYDLNNPEDFYLPDYQDVSPVYSILGAVLAIAGALILFKVFKTIA